MEMQEMSLEEMKAEDRRIRLRYIRQAEAKMKSAQKVLAEATSEYFTQVFEYEAFFGTLPPLRSEE